MRQFRLTLLALMIASCSAGATLNIDKPDSAAIALLTLETKIGELPTEATSWVSDTWLTVTDPDVLGPAVESPQPAHTTSPEGPEEFHSADISAFDPIERQAPPDSSNALNVATWVGTAMLNFDTESPIPTAEISRHLAPSFVLEADERSQSTAADAGKASRAILVNAWVEPSESTSTLVSAFAVFERSIRIGTDQSPVFDFAYFDMTAALADGGWQIVQLQVSFA